MELIVPSEYIEYLLDRVARSKLHLERNVIEAFETLPRTHFVMDSDKSIAYIDRPLRIPSNQTISAPHMYAIMLASELGDPQESMKILEIGTGSGYGAGLLGISVNNGSIITIERHEKLVEFAKHNLDKAGIKNVQVIHADGTKGVEDQLFDRIVVTAAAKKIPEHLLTQLKLNGRLIIPLDYRRDQWLTKIIKLDKDIQIQRLMRVMFVPLIFS